MTTLNNRRNYIHVSIQQPIPIMRLCPLLARHLPNGNTLDCPTLETVIIAARHLDMLIENEN